MSSRRTRSVLAAASALSVLALAACSAGTSDGGAQSGGDGKIKVVAATDVWGSVVSAVGGDKVEVKAIIHDPSADPHSYETTADDALAAKDAKLLVSNGGGYDDFFDKLTVAAGDAKQLVAFDSPRTADNNEHVFYDLPGVKKVADQVAEDLGEHRRVQAGVHRQRQDVRRQARRWRSAREIATRPGKKVVVTEPVANYLLTAGNVADATPKEFEEAVEAGTDIPVAAVADYQRPDPEPPGRRPGQQRPDRDRLTNQLKAKAATAGIPVVDVTETLPAGTTDYVGWIGKEADALSKALAKQGRLADALVHAAPVPAPAAALASGPGTRVRRGLDLDIRPGEFLAVLGPNGSGKTSMLRVLLGQQPLSAGEVAIAGSAPGKANHKIGYIPQQRSIDPNLTLRGRDLSASASTGTAGARACVAGGRAPARGRRAGRGRRRDYADHPVGLLSGGEQQRLRVAQALVGDPQLLLCDEPLLSLDLAHQRVVSDLIDARRRAAGTAVLFVTTRSTPCCRWSTACSIWSTAGSGSAPRTRS